MGMLEKQNRWEAQTIGLQRNGDRRDKSKKEEYEFLQQYEKWNDKKKCV